jgi:hypothetical protein
MKDLALATALVQRIKAGTMAPVALALVSAALISAGAEPGVDAAGEIIVPRCDRCAHADHAWGPRVVGCGDTHDGHEHAVPKDFFCRYFQVKL